VTRRDAGRVAAGCGVVAPNTVREKMGLLVASLTTPEIGYFSVVATVIPVLWVGYVINLDVIKLILEPLVNRLGYELDQARFVHSRRRPREPLPPAAVRARYSSYGLLLTSVAAFVVAFLAPAGAVVLALLALLNDRGTSLERAGSFAGTLCAVLVVLIPVVYIIGQQFHEGYVVNKDSASPRQSSGGDAPQRSIDLG